MDVLALLMTLFVIVLWSLLFLAAAVCVITGISICGLLHSLRKKHRP